MTRQLGNGERELLLTEDRRVTCHYSASGFITNAYFRKYHLLLSKNIHNDTAAMRHILKITFVEVKRVRIGIGKLETKGNGHYSMRYGVLIELDPHLTNAHAENDVQRFS